MQTTEPPVTFKRVEVWTNSLEVKTITDWTTLTQNPNDDQISSTRDALTKSGCPSGIVDILLYNSDLRNWTNHLKNRRNDGYDIDNMKKLTCRSIPGAPVVYVARSDNELVPPTGLLFIFDSLVA
ncbi:E3 ubiquitin-protein ligase NRDP1-like [Adelges cooleyi]|uniref:E3 ubiquitin-protein ligase NRDP1-like n=1 Tax=Adelges cooleyi TaxID=133065 RepID=UPI0021803112|nr:E3 ubiquitin-protein ligase NRDP1-like [Adelges cooleyi]